MQHAEFRRLFGANPRRTEPEVLAHRAECAECARYAADLERVDALVSGALEVPGPAATPMPWESEQEKKSPLRWYALAASVVLAVGLGFGAWLHAQRQVLFAELLKHAHAESNVMVVSEKRVSEEKLQSTLGKAGAQLQSLIPVSTARLCKVRGVVAPHLFVQTANGPVQILLLTEHRFLTRHSAEDQGLLAELVPMGSHSVAVFAANAAAVANGREIARQHITWAPEPR